MTPRQCLRQLRKHFLIVVIWATFSILVNSSKEQLDRFFETLLSEINSDDGPNYMKFRQLLLASLNNEHPDDFFIAICGWSLELLMERV